MDEILQFTESFSLALAALSETQDILMKKQQRRSNMIILQGGRCSGKTSNLIKQAYGTNAAILTYSQSMADCIRIRAKEMGMSDVRVFSYEDIKNNKNIRYQNKKFYIDELPMFLQQLLGIDVCIATGDIECFSINNIK